MTKNSFTTLPEGYASIPVTEDQEKASLKICVMVKGEADSVGGHLVVLRDTIDAKVDRKSTRLNSSHTDISRMPSSA